MKLPFFQCSSGSKEIKAIFGTSLFGEARLDGFWVHACWQTEALVEALRGVAPPVRGFLLVLRLHHHRVVHRLDNKLLQCRNTLTVKLKQNHSVPLACTSPH